jgi:hypothetical protein
VIPVYPSRSGRDELLFGGLHWRLEKVVSAGSARVVFTHALFLTFSYWH